MKLFEVTVPKFHLDFTDQRSDQLLLVLQQLTNEMFAVTPEFTLPDKLKKPSVYKRFLNQDIKEEFRKKLLLALTHQWTAQFGAEIGETTQQLFLDAVKMTEQSGAMIFADLIQRTDFSMLVNRYDEILENFGNKSWLHSYVNLGNHPDFLNDQSFRQAFLHPLIIAVIAYQIGGAIRIVDARAKNAEPISIKAQDNMLHIDNTPFNEEFKVIVTWEKHKASGPKGQNFVIIPGTHKGVRNCFVKNDNAFSTENGSIFIHEATVQQVFDIQQQMLGSKTPQVVEVCDRERPLTTLFAAGSLVHHRYRTESGFSRSCMILAFHRSGDNPGQFIDHSHINTLPKLNSLNRLLFGFQNTESDLLFIEALSEEAGIIAKKLEEIRSELANTTAIITPQSRELSQAELLQWKQTVTSAPTIEDIKKEKLQFPLGAILEQEEFVELLQKMMMMDKHGPLDLILYDDSHEEIRKWGRNRIREMKEQSLIQHLLKWQNCFLQPQLEQVMLPETMADCTRMIIESLDRAAKNPSITAQLAHIEKISPQDAVRSLRQLTLDLGEAIGRCDTSQTYLSTSLFIFWALDEVIRLYPVLEPELQETGRKLLGHYVSTSVLIEKQVAHELKPEKLASRVSKLSIFPPGSHQPLASNSDNIEEKVTKLYQINP
ncbi:MAG: hypothetical protein JJT82_08530 [Legionellaceae bacterium]|nr:hypothetical protein [Legionellaceae bacterium]